MSNKKDSFLKLATTEEFCITPALPSRNGKQNPKNIYCSHDKYNELLEYLDQVSQNEPLAITLYDEIRSITPERYADIVELIRVLNTKNIKSINLRLSDEALQIYNLIMYKAGWQHQDNTKLYLSIDRHPTDEKKLNLTYAMGQIKLPEEKLIWVPKYVLRNLENRINPRVFSETKKLKIFLNKFNTQIKQNYRYEELDDIDKTLIVYDYIKNNISFAMDRTFIPETTKIRTIVPDEDNWQSRPYGTLEHKRGVCEGQARLMVAMLSNPFMGVDATTINGSIPSGERHTWVGIHTNDKLYECCTTMQGPFKKLENYGYKPDKDEQYTSIYKRSFLTDSEYSQACAKVLSKKR